MKQFILSIVLFFPTLKPMSVVDPCFNDSLPTESKLLEDSLPPIMFYFVGGAAFAGAMAYLRFKY